MMRYTVIRTPMTWAPNGNDLLPVGSPEIRTHCLFKAWSGGDGDNFTFEVDGTEVKCYLYGMEISLEGAWQIDVADGNTDYVRYTVVPEIDPHD